MICAPPISTMAISAYTDELALLQALRAIYCMDLGRTNHLPMDFRSKAAPRQARRAGADPGPYCGRCALANLVALVDVAIGYRATSPLARLQLKNFPAARAGPEGCVCRIACAGRRSSRRRAPSFFQPRAERLRH